MEGDNYIKCLFFANFLKKLFFTCNIEEDKTILKVSERGEDNLIFPEHPVFFLLVSMVNRWRIISHSQLDITC